MLQKPIGDGTEEQFDNNQLGGEPSDHERVAAKADNRIKSAVLAAAVGLKALLTQTACDPASAAASEKDESKGEDRKAKAALVVKEGEVDTPEGDTTEGEGTDDPPISSEEEKGTVQAQISLLSEDAKELKAWLLENKSEGLESGDERKEFWDVEKARYKAMKEKMGQLQLRVSNYENALLDERLAELDEEGHELDEELEQERGETAALDGDLEREKEETRQSEEDLKKAAEEAAKVTAQITSRDKTD